MQGRGRQTLRAVLKIDENYWEAKTTNATYRVWVGDLPGQLTIHREDEGTERHWYDLQGIKNFFFGRDSIAVEIFPKHKDLVDGQNQTHLWKIPSENHHLLPNLKHYGGA